jgi:hypothetical protein
MRDSFDFALVQPAPRSKQFKNMQTAQQRMPHLDHRHTQGSNSVFHHIFLAEAPTESATDDLDVAAPVVKPDPDFEPTPPRVQGQAKRAKIRTKKA